MMGVDAKDANRALALASVGAGYFQRRTYKHRGSDVSRVSHIQKDTCRAGDVVIVVRFPSPAT